MYHICPARCQTQFIHGEDADGEKARSAFLSAEFGVELAAAVVGRLARMNKGDNPAFGDRFFNLGIAENHFACLIGERKSGNRRLGEKPVNLGIQALWRSGLLLEGPSEGVAL